MALKNANVANAQPAHVMQDETEAAPVAQAATPGAQFDTSTAPNANTAVAASANHPVGPVAPANSGGAFASLEDGVGYGSFPQVKLVTDAFAVGEDGECDSFDFQPIGSKARWIVKASDCTSDNDGTFFFTYDNVTATDGRPCNQIFEDWKANGLTVKEKREYQEVMGYIRASDKGDFANRMVILSLPPTSKSRLSGVQAELRVTKGLTLDQVVLRVQKGGKITTKAKKVFYPWDFKFISTVEAYAPVVPVADGDAE